MSLAKTLDAEIRKLTEAGCDSPKREAQMLWEHANGEEVKFAELLERRLQREPISQIVGERGFWQHDFIVTADVLTPRPDSEVLIEEALHCLPDKNAAYRFLDLGTGSGCLILSLLHEYPNATGIAIDASKKALEVAKRNAEKLNLLKRVEFIEGNWAEGLTERVDLVISNPPYIPSTHYDNLMPEVRDYEPRIALIGANDGLGFYREIANQLPDCLGKDGWLIFEVGEGQAQSVATIAQEAGFALYKFRKDYGGIERAVLLRKE